MSLQTHYEFLFVGRDEGSFVENYAYDLGEGGEQSGKIFINLEVQNNLADAELIGETIFDTLRKGFFTDLEKEPYARFEDALKHVNRALNELRAERKSRYIGDLHVVIAAVVGNDLFLTQTGEAEAYLIRRRFCTTISEGLFDPDSKDLFSNIASGTLEADDFVLLSTTRLVRYLSKTELVKIASNGTLMVILQQLRESLSTEMLGRAGFIGVHAIHGTPQFKSREKDRMVAHLKKEEEYQEDFTEQHKSVNVVVKDFSKQVFALAADLQKRFQELRGNRGTRTSQRSIPNLSKRVQIGNWSKDKIFGVLIVVVLLLTVGVWWLRGQADEQQRVNAYAATLNEVQEAIAIAQKDGQFEKEKAGELLNDAEKKAIDVLNSGYSRAKATELLSLIKVERDNLDGVVRVEPKVMADLSEKRSTVNALGLVALKNDLFAYEYNALYPVLLDKVLDPVAIGENETIISATPYEDKNSLLFFTKEGRVLEYLDNHVTSLSATDGAFHKGYAVQAYSNRLYVLDPAGNKIWKYTRRRDNFDTAEPYNADGDLSKAISFAIDGNVFVLNSDGMIQWFYGGNIQNYVMKKAPIRSLTVPSKLYTEIDMQQVYVLEPSTQRIMVFFKDDKGANNKSLVYSQQYIFEGLNDVRDFYVDKDAKKIFLLDQSKVYQFSM